MFICVTDYRVYVDHVSLPGFCSGSAHVTALSLPPQARTAAVKTRADLLSEMHFRGLKQKALLLSRTQEASRHLETSKAQTRSGWVQAR